MTCKERLLE